MKKTLLGIAMASAMIAGSSIADVVDNDIDQFAVGNAQINGLLDLSLGSIGPTVFDGTNVANIADMNITLAVDDAYGNDVTQVGAFLLQGNGVVSASFLDVGKTVFTGQNIINYATVDIKALDNVKSNDVAQAVAHSSQTNTLVNAHVVDLGKTKFSGSNVANYAEIDLDASRPVGGDTEEADRNDLDQAAFELLQGNRVIDLVGFNAGKTVFDGQNVVNYGKVSIDAEDADFNDVNQTIIGSVLQYNSLVMLHGVNAGVVKFTGGNIANFADVEYDLVYGASDGDQTAIGNDIDQSATEMLQVNSVLVLGDAQFGKVKFDGTNAVNVASFKIDTDLIEDHSLIGNDIDQDVSSVAQINSLAVGEGIHLGKVKFDGVNVANQATLDLKAADFIGFNDVDQTATGVVQLNGVTHVSGFHGGGINVSGTNIINSGTVNISAP